MSDIPVENLKIIQSSDLEYMWLGHFWDYVLSAYVRYKGQEGYMATSHGYVTCPDCLNEDHRVAAYIVRKIDDEIFKLAVYMRDYWISCYPSNQTDSRPLSDFYSHADTIKQVLGIDLSIGHHDFEPVGICYSDISRDKGFPSIIPDLNYARVINGHLHIFGIPSSLLRPPMEIDIQFYNTMSLVDGMYFKEPLVYPIDVSLCHYEVDVSRCKWGLRLDADGGKISMFEEVDLLDCILYELSSDIYSYHYGPNRLNSGEIGFIEENVDPDNIGSDRLQSAIPGFIPTLSQ